jgi:hypothetical protein
VLKYLCEQPGIVQHYLIETAPAVVLVPVDLFDLPSSQFTDLYRTILHAFYWVRERFTPTLAEVTANIYREYRATTDAFLAQQALYELVLAFQQSRTRVVLVMNRFDRFCEISTPQMVNTLRSLRDRFKETLSFIVGMRQAVAYLPDPTLLGDMYELFDSHICYIGALAAEDSRLLLTNLLRTAPAAPTDSDIDMLIRLSGGFPSLLKAIGQWWKLTTPRPAMSDWLQILLRDTAIQYRLERLWHGLTQEEKQVLGEVHKQASIPWAAQQKSRAPASEPQPGGNGHLEAAGSTPPLQQQVIPIIRRLAAKGCCRIDGAGWSVNGELLAAFVGRNVGGIRGRIWFDEALQSIHQGQHVVEGLTPLEFDILRFLIANPRARHTSDTIIDNAWPVNENKETITPNNLQVHISSVRKKIEPNPTAPRYLITWHGRPGGYQFFPEGKPE